MTTFVKTSNTNPNKNIVMNKFIKGILSVFFVIYLYSCSVVPITGRREFNLTNDNEILSASKEQYNYFLQNNRINNNGVSNRTALAVAQRLAQVTDSYLRKNNYEDLARTLNWEFNVVESPQVNAFCMPGGKIVVYTGLINLIGNSPNSQAMLAAVLGHEIGHAIARHANERMSNNLLLGIGGAVLGVAMRKQSQLTQLLVGFGYNAGSQLFIALPFSRKQEYEADKIGLVLMSMAGYDPRHAIELWQRMSQKSGNNKPMELVSTHPSDEHRIQEIEKYLPEAMKYFSASSITNR